MPGGIVDNQYLLGNKNQPGSHAYTGQIVREDGETLHYGLVIDNRKGNALDPLARMVNTLSLDLLRKSSGSNIPLIITTTIEQTNRKILESLKTKKIDIQISLVMAVIYQGRCFIGNAGNNRAFWIKSTTSNNSGRILQLTRDHTLRNLYPSQLAGAIDTVVNSLGNSENIQVDLGFYLKGAEVSKAYEMGLMGLPMHPGDTILLCSNGLAMADPLGTQFVSDASILNETSTISGTGTAEKIAGVVERKYQQKISTVTIQSLEPGVLQLVSTLSSQVKRVRLQRIGLISLGILGAALMALFLLGRSLISPGLITNLLANNQAGAAIMEFTHTPGATTVPVTNGQAIVDLVTGAGATVNADSFIQNGDVVNSGDGVVRVRVGGNHNRDSLIYLFPNSSAQILYAETLSPILNFGALYIQPGSLVATVDLSTITAGLTASVSGSRMIVEVKEGEVWVYCFEGRCLLEIQNEGPVRVPPGNKLKFDVKNLVSEKPVVMSLDEKWLWNEACELLCLSDFLPTPTTTEEGHGEILPQTTNTLAFAWTYTPTKTQKGPNSTPKPTSTLPLFPTLTLTPIPTESTEPPTPTFTKTPKPATTEPPHPSKTPTQMNTPHPTIDPSETPENPQPSKTPDPPEPTRTEEPNPTGTPAGQLQVFQSTIRYSYNSSMVDLLQRWLNRNNPVFNNSNDNPFLYFRQNQISGFVRMTIE